MDVIGFLDDLARGDLLRWKVALSTVVFALAGLQVALAARFSGVSAVPAVVPPRVAALLHRGAGTFAVVLAVVVGVACLAGPAGATSPLRVALHTAFGSLLFAALAAKFLLLRVVRSPSRLLPVAGTALFLAFAGVWATSVADYVSTR